MENKANTDNRSRVVLAVILITIGGIWLLQQIGLQLHLKDLFHPFFVVFSYLGRIVFSWPMILVIAGLVLVAGQRSGGWVLVVVGSVFLIPRIFHLPDFSFSMVFPLALVAAGIAMVVRRF